MLRIAEMDSAKFFLHENSPSEIMNEYSNLFIYVYLLFVEICKMDKCRNFEKLEKSKKMRIPNIHSTGLVVHYSFNYC